MIETDSTPAPVLTLTGNLLSERTFEFSAWAPGRVQRAVHAEFQVGGKGINVSRMLQRLGASTTALCFAGGATGAECEDWLKLRPFAHRVFATTQPTRAGIVIRGGSHPETTFLGPDAVPDAAAIAACAGFLDTQPAGRSLAVCGSMPGWASADFEPLRAALSRWVARGLLVVDTYGPALAWLVKQPLALVKINASELRTLFPAALETESTPDLISRAREQSPVLRWVVTDGGAPVWFGDVDAPLASAAPPRIEEVSPTGSGDVLLACLIDRYFRRSQTLADAVRGALPYAAANAAHRGIAEFPLPVESA